MATTHSSVAGPTERPHRALQVSATADQCLTHAPTQAEIAVRRNFVVAAGLAFFSGRAVRLPGGLPLSRRRILHIQRRFMGFASTGFPARTEGVAGGGGDASGKDARRVA